MGIKKNSSNSVIWPVWILAACVVLQLIVYLLRFHGSLSYDSSDWSAFASYMGISFSILSVLLVYLTYRNQVRMSAILQFESVFFQWHSEHRAICQNLKDEIDAFSEEVALRFIKEHKGAFSIDGFLRDSDDSSQRKVMRFYRSLYHFMKYVHLSPILEGEEQKKKMYFDIIQAQMSDAEQYTAFYLLMTDKWKDSTQVLGCSLIEMVDKYHLFKNLYYGKNEANFKEFAAFMNDQFRNTSGSFQFLEVR